MDMDNSRRSSAFVDAWQLVHGDGARRRCAVLASRSLTLFRACAPPCSTYSIAAQVLVELTSPQSHIAARLSIAYDCHAAQRRRRSRRESPVSLCASAVIHRSYSALAHWSALSRLDGASLRLPLTEGRL